MLSSSSSDSERFMRRTSRFGDAEKCCGETTSSLEKSRIISSRSSRLSRASLQTYTLDIRTTHRGSRLAFGQGIHAGRCKLK